MSILRPKDGEEYIDRGLALLVIWFCVGWVVTGGLGLLVGLFLNHATGETNWTTGSTLTGMATYIPVGVIGYDLYLKAYWHKVL